MSYQVLARKWRPKNFSDLVGQAHVTQALMNALTHNRLHHAYLLTGTRGVGKTTLARILAKSLNCEVGVSANPCCQCNACLQIDQGHFIDLFEIDAASNTGVDNIREILEDTQYASAVGRFKIYIIDEAHMLSKSAFNAMLKTLEEPPDHIKFILATTDPHKLPITVLSRCLAFNLRNMTLLQISDHLQHILKSESIAYESNAIQLLARAAEGSMRDALSLLDQAIAYHPDAINEISVRTMLGAAHHQALVDLIIDLANCQPASLISKANALIAEGVNPSNALTELSMLFHQIALLQIIPDAPIDNDALRVILLDLARRFLPEDVQLYYQISLHGKQDIALAPDESSGFLMTLLRLTAFQIFNGKPPASFIQKPIIDHISINRALEDKAVRLPQPNTLSNQDRIDSNPSKSNASKTGSKLAFERQKIQQKAAELLDNDPLAKTLKEEFGATLSTETAKLLSNIT